MKKYITDINNGIYIKEEKINKDSTKTNNTIEILDNKKITRFYGFGSAITESSGFNYDKLSIDNKKKFINDYFGKNGLNYNYGRISIGSNDFSLNSFSYAKKTNLSDFNIDQDKKYVIPFLNDILNKKKISLIASPWSPPKMYKRLPILRWGIKLAKKHYEDYSLYLLRFIDEYKKLGIKIDYLTMQNEPMARQRWESCKFTILEQKEFIYNYLMDKLKDTKILLWDHNKDNLFNIINELHIDNDVIAGVAFHYYTGHCFDELKKLREKYPDKLLINSEMCCGYSKYKEKEWLSAAEYYLRDIIGDMNAGVNAYLDWNILLDEYGGPTHSKNYVKSASIRVNDNYIKTPIYYYLYHVSHFISNECIIIDNKNNTNLKVVGFKSKDKLSVILMNNSNQSIEYNLLLKKNNIYDKINAHSIITYEL